MVFLPINNPEILICEMIFKYNQNRNDSYHEKENHNTPSHISARPSMRPGVRLCIMGGMIFFVSLCCNWAFWRFSSLDRAGFLGRLLYYFHLTNPRSLI